jgi:hypothetical protein
MRMIGHRKAVPFGELILTAIPCINTLQIAVKSHKTQIMMQDCSNQGIHFEFVLTS